MLIIKVYIDFFIKSFIESIKTKWNKNFNKHENIDNIRFLQAFSPCGIGCCLALFGLWLD